MEKTIIEALREALPPTFSRQVAAKAMAGIISAGRLKNLDSQGKGPGGVHIGRTMAYERESFLVWLSGRINTESLGNRLGGRVSA